MEVGDTDPFGVKRPRSFSCNIEAEAHEEDLLLNAVFAFNANPREGIKALCRVKRFEETPEKIAEILRFQKGLLGRKVASFLSKNLNIMHEYFNTFDLKRPFVEALRLAFSGNLGLQGEAEFIDKELNIFSQVYCLQNPDTFSSIDNAYMLAFATTLLLSDLHNPQVKSHMTIQQFIQNIRGVISESTLSDNILSEVYKQVKTKPFKNENSDDILAMSDPRLKGYLMKKNDKWNSTWTTRFFVLANSCIYYFLDNSPDNKDNPLGMIQLVAVEAFIDPKNPKRFYISAKDKNEIMYVKFKEKGPDLMKGVKKITFEAQSESARDKWLYRITKSLICSLFTDNVNNENPLDTFGTSVGISSDEHDIESVLSLEKSEISEMSDNQTAPETSNENQIQNIETPIENQSEENKEKSSEVSSFEPENHSETQNIVEKIEIQNQDQKCEAVDKDEKQNENQDGDIKIDQPVIESEISKEGQNLKSDETDKTIENSSSFIDKKVVFNTTQFDSNEPKTLASSLPVLSPTFLYDSHGNDPFMLTENENHQNENKIENTKRTHQEINEKLQNQEETEKEVKEKEETKNEETAHMNENGNQNQKDTKEDENVEINHEKVNNENDENTNEEGNTNEKDESGTDTSINSNASNSESKIEDNKSQNENENTNQDLNDNSCQIEIETTSNQEIQNNENEVNEKNEA